MEGQMVQKSSIENFQVSQLNFFSLLHGCGENYFNIFSKINTITSDTIFHLAMCYHFSTRLEFEGYAVL